MRILLFFVAAALVAQQADLAEKQRASVEAAMRESMERQKASVRRQVNAKEDSFFIVPMDPMPIDTPPVAQMECDPMEPGEAESLVAQNAKTKGLLPSVLRAVIEQESAFHPCAVSRSGAQGLMQLMPATADHLGVTDPFDPVQNVEAGSRYLKELLDRYGGNLMLALAAYNAGPGRVDAFGGIPPITETGRYVDQILKKVMADQPTLLQ
jgi:soluble lytic murein transglycosylase-like protein